MQWFKSARPTPRFLSAHSRSHSYDQVLRYHMTASDHRADHDAAFRTWREVAGTASA